MRLPKIKGTLLGTPNREPQEYSRYIIAIYLPGSLYSIIFLLYSWGSLFGVPSRVPLKIKGTFLGVPNHKDYNILGFILVSPHVGKLFKAPKCRMLLQLGMCLVEPAHKGVGEVCDSWTLREPLLWSEVLGWAWGTLLRQKRSTVPRLHDFSHPVYDVAAHSATPQEHGP